MKWYPQKPVVRCTYCDKSYSSQRNLQLHLRIHREVNVGDTNNINSLVIVNEVHQSESEESNVALNLSSNIDNINNLIDESKEVEKVYDGLNELSSDKTNEGKEEEIKDETEQEDRDYLPPLHYFKKSSTRLKNPAKKPNNSLTCAECSSVFSTRSNLKKHVKKFHPDQIKAYFVPRKFTYTCKTCGHGFTHRRNYICHARKHDSSAFADEVIKSKHPKKCPRCDFKHSYAKKMHEHFKEDHDFEVVEKDLEFSCEKDLLQWRHSLETSTNSKFIKKGIDIFKEHTNELYICHRSGDYIPEGKGIRNLKNQGSHKINAFCPASIKIVKYKPSCKFKVTYIDTHFGHELDVKHLYLSPQDKHQIARRIASKVPFKDILEEFKNAESTTSKRLHLLTTKDLYNIKKSMNLKDLPLDISIDDTSLNSALTDLKLTTGDSVLFYKPRGTDITDQPELDISDFVLVIMTPTQCNFLETYGESFLCVDNYSFNDFEINVLLVIDDFREGFPCAFLISNRSDKIVLNILFTQIKLKTGPFQTKTFMSDFGDKYFQSWLKVMPLPEHRLISTWHLENAWLKNLEKEDIGKQTELKKHLHALLEEENVYNFENLLHQLCNIHYDDEPNKFIDYFKDNFFNNYKDWAPCTKGIDYGTILNLIRSRKTIQHLIKFKKFYELDKMIKEFTKHINDKLFDRLLVTDDEKIMSKIKTIRLRHKEMLKLDVNTVKIVHYGWEVPSNNTKEVYFIRERNITCHCQQFCADCQTCIHKYFCTCLDSMSRFNMCKHVHLLVKYRKMFEPLPISEPLPCTEPDHDDNYECVQNLVVAERHQEETPLTEITFVNINIDEEKQKIVEQLLKHLENITCVNKLEVVKNMVDSIPAAVEAVDQIEYSRGFSIQ
ncbi:unnamed protein product [Brassicogethes aeneus]|uniref:C2H2-type domain-containing protein n=1 Tax=Brassicogethes aeneus TaxID=1431903 RepID=A0A9P0B434_BRAAE|nr:unnamed protein product [Brassicogethes aeneus]